MTLAVDSRRIVVAGSTRPRIAPPEPAKHFVQRYSAMAACQGITLMPWQMLVAKYLMATGPDGWLYREIAVVVARRNGKTELLLPRVEDDLLQGRKVIHTAQNRTLPRQIYMRLARHMEAKHAELLDGMPRYANGQEQITMLNGGSYQIVAPQRGARGLGADTFIFDELREFEDDDIIGAAEPTLHDSPDPQRIYLSNAGHERSVILNDLKRRGEDGGDDLLAYLEWSAAPERAMDDRVGWAEANPAMGRPEHPAGKRMLLNLEEAYRSVPAAQFETEHLCRWVASMQPRLVSEAAWQQCKGTTAARVRPAIGFSMAANGSRASAVMAWQQSDGRVAVEELLEVYADGDFDTARFGTDLKRLALDVGARELAFASWTDKDIAHFVPRAKPLDGKDFCAASEKFARLVSGGRLVWSKAPHISDELAWTARRPHDSGAWMAVPAAPDRSVTSVLAAVRAVWLASAPKPDAPRIG